MSTGSPGVQSPSPHGGEVRRGRAWGSVGRAAGDEVGQGPDRAWGWQMSVGGALGRVMGSCEVRGYGGGEAGTRTGHGSQQRRNRVLCGGDTVSGATALRGHPRGGRWEGAVWGGRGGAPREF